MNCTVRQAVGVWDELVDAYHDSNGYGGTVAEIYSYRFEPYSPGVHSNGSNVSSMYMEEAIRIAKDAAMDLLELIKIFKEKYDCDVLVEDLTLEGWEQQLNSNSGRHHRYHVHIISIEEE